METQEFIVNAFNLAAFLVTGYFTIISLSKIANQQYQSIYLVIPLFFVFFGVGPFLDIFLGLPAYPTRAGFRLASQDITTAIIYDVYIILVCLYWWLISKSQGRRFRFNQNLSALKRKFSPKKNQRKILKTILVFSLYTLLISPIFITLLFHPDPSIYLEYGAILQAKYRGLEINQFSRFISLSTILSVMAGGGILAIKRNVTVARILTIIPWIFIAVWINGKRNIFAFVLVIFGYTLLRKNVFKKDTFYIALLAAILALGSISFAYQSTVRDKNLDTVGAALLYEGIRTDFSRDDVTKLSIYAQLNPDVVQVLDYPGQSLIFNLGGWAIPRSMWKDKPIPYGKYILAAAHLYNPSLRSAAMTPSILSEGIDNFGWLGMPLGPIIIGFICGIGDAKGKAWTSALTLLLAFCLLTLTLQVIYFPIFMPWVISMLTQKKPKQIRIIREPALRP